MELSDKEKLKQIEEGLKSFWSQFGPSDFYSNLTLDVLLEELSNYNEKVKTNPPDVSLSREKR